MFKSVAVLPWNQGGTGLQKSKCFLITFIISTVCTVCKMCKCKFFLLFNYCFHFYPQPWTLHYFLIFVISTYYIVPKLQALELPCLSYLLSYALLYIFIYILRYVIINYLYWLKNWKRRSVNIRAHNLVSLSILIMYCIFF